MPQTQTTQNHEEIAKKLVRELLMHYQILTTHTTKGGEVTEGTRLEDIFQSHQTHIIDLVAEGLTTGRVPF